jgi:hypothetical protein
MAKKVWVVSFKSKELGVYTPLLVIDAPTDKVRGVMDRFITCHTGPVTNKMFDLNDCYLSQVFMDAYDDGYKTI